MSKELADRYDANCTIVTLSRKVDGATLSAQKALGIPIVTMQFWVDLFKKVELNEESPDCVNYAPKMQSPEKNYKRSSSDLIAKSSAGRKPKIHPQLGSVKRQRTSTEKV
jgi:hypothetical protein